MFHEHPIRILKYSAKNIWLLIFPFIRGILTYHFSKDFLYTWLQGAWFDLLVVAAILLFGLVRWYFSVIELTENEIIHKDGIFICVKTSIPYKNISSATIESPIHLAAFRAVRVRCDTRAGIFRTADLKLIVMEKRCTEIMEKMPDIMDKTQSHELKKPSLLSILLFSIFFSSGFSGTIYIAMFFFKGGDIAHDIISVSLSRLTRETEKLTNKWILKIPAFALMIGIFFIASWLISIIVNMTRYVRFRIETDNKCLKVSYGLFNRMESRIRLSHVNYTDFRQNLIMKLFGAVAVHISCAGYGSAKSRLPVLLPVKSEKKIGSGLEILGITGKLENSFCAKKMGYLSYIMPPFLCSAAIFPLFTVIVEHIPKLYELMFFIAVMLEIPSVWLVIVKLAALFTSGISIYDETVMVRCSKWTKFYTVIAGRDNVAKIELEQNVLQKISGRCAVSIWFGSEEYKRFKVKAMSAADGVKIAEMLECGLSECKIIPSGLFLK